MAGYWLKLYTEILDDPKYYRLSDNAKLGMYELMLVAKKVGFEGDLPSIADIEFYTRRQASWWVPVIDELKAIEFIVVNENGDKIRKFEERQAAVTVTEKQRYYRESLHKKEFSSYEPVTDALRNVTESKSKSTDVEVEKEIDVDADSGSGLVSTFLELYPGLKPRSDQESPSWDLAYSRMQQAGVTPAIMRRAARELADKAMKVASPGSLVNPCLMVMQREKKRVPDSAGSFKEYINH